MRTISRWLAFACLSPGLTSIAWAQAGPPEPSSTRDRAARIATQPARDLGLQRTAIPPALERAGADPYSLAGLRTCANLSTAIVELNGALGPDFDAPPEPSQVSRRQQVAEAGGRAVVDSVIPFRGLVREVSGSAGAERRLRAAIDAGIARRGFLRGLAQARGCRTGFGAAR